ncbi:hypothetical protein [Mycoplasma sp. HS2188]|uniref:hypothetical protein n=1 Tax=Mycoplasma sp. HS2188 TaxID=2976765 RepID=UPI0021AA3288|nr:hypothetical protein [Mycoplasma sp. HS2188]MCT4469407.1 hypothetical protein [Mycoplasma sp. HS2188]
MKELEKAKKIAVPLLVLSIILYCSMIIFVYGQGLWFVKFAGTTSNESNREEVRSLSVALLIFIPLILLGIWISALVLQILLTIRASKIDQTAMILLIVGFVVPIVSIVGTIFILVKKDNDPKPLNSDSIETTAENITEIDKN